MAVATSQLADREAPRSLATHPAGKLPGLARRKSELVLPAKLP
jgi:hypothetical protein